jgi:hypothetical protein
MPLSQLALVSEIPEVPASELTQVSAALQKQLARDFSPLWSIDATIDAFTSLEDVPLGYWPIVIRTDIGYAGAAGIHRDDQGQPFALVQYSTTWSLTTSHEILEMLADPFGNTLRASDSIKPDQGRVEYLIEVCDPSEAYEFGYTVNGIRVSDFYTPNFFDPVTAPSVRYSFTGAITEPRQVLKGGYLSWHDPVTDHWWQQQYFGAKRTFHDLGVLESATNDIRFEIEKRTPVDWKLRGLPKGDARLKTAKPTLLAAAGSASSKAESWRAQIEALKGEYRKS